MMTRIAGLIAGAVFSAGVAQASPDVSQAASPNLENRAQLVAERMSQGASYDQATRAVPLPSDELSRAIAQEMMNSRITYRQARLTISERTDVVNGRWNKHLVAMASGGSHEAGWAASSGH